MGLVRLLRFAKIAVLVADVWTILYVVLIVGWQTYIFLAEGSWPVLSVKFVLSKLQSKREVYETAATRGIRGAHLPDAMDALLQIPAVVPLIFSAALLTAFYLWLSHIKTEHKDS